MRRFRFLLPFFWLFVALPGFAASPAAPFTPISEEAARARGGGEKCVNSVSYRLFETDIARLRDLLQLAPLEGRQEPRPTFLVPLPDGNLAPFAVHEVRIMAGPLALRFPEIRTYRGQGLDDPASLLICDITPSGFHGMILNSKGTIYIDPFFKDDPRFVSSSYKRDLRRAGNRPPFFCEANDLGPSQEESLTLFEEPRTPSGATLRTYRLALAGTGEYTTAVCAPNPAAVACGLAAMVTSMNRVNGIYEREVAIRMVLISSNDRIIYTDGTADPYTNGSGSAMLGENQSNLDAVIGTANYDIGHVFSTGGGGVAQLSGPCNASRKAMGVTGSQSPTGDSFDVDYVAHEMGHQFGGYHTFNGTTSNCNGNRSSSAAYEPGSGSTIMAYAGICGAEDLQPHSDDYFHSKSFDQIVAFSTGSGNSCAVQTATGNGAPSVNAGGTYTVPKQTPFTLMGSATDLQGDALTYCWEEYDLGTAAPPNDDLAAVRPIFRSFLPVTSPSRTFPRLADILSGTATFGESMSQRTRTMAFRLSARDNRSGGGGVDYASTTVSINASAGPFTVTQPSLGASWPGLSQQTVQWDVASTNLSPVNCANVTISLSTDGGNSFPATLLASTPNDGSQAVTVPNTATTAARVKVACVNNIFFDISNPNFTITASASFNLTVERTGSGSGSVTSTPAGISCPSTCAASFAQGQNVVLHAAANAGSTFTGWSGEGCTGTADCSVLMSQARLVSANFEPCASPAAFTLESPVNGGTAPATPVTLTWTASSGAASYDVYFGTTSPPALLTTVTTTSVQAAVMGGTTYYWRVAARNACATVSAPATGSFSFSVPSPPLSALQLASVDGQGGSATVSNLNGLFEPGETVMVSPSWMNSGLVPAVVSSLASAFTGPAGPVYSLTDPSAAYGTVQPGATVNCYTTTGNCIQLGVSVPAARPALHWDASFTETLATGAVKSWTLHIGNSFTDVPPAYWAYRFVETILHNRVTAGCSATTYCPENMLTRAEMAVLLLAAKNGPGWAPPQAKGTVFADVPASHWAAAFIEQLAADGITSGCGGGNYCPASPMTRAQMAVFLLVAKHGSSWTPPPATGTVFSDVPAGYWAGAFIEQLAAEGITGGCGGGNFCPDSSVTRAQMAVFLTTTFNLKLY